MGRAPCCDKTNVKRGPWSPEEDSTLKNYLESHGTGGNWISLPQKAGLRRCGKSCRLRWLNYLRPDIKHGGFTEEEDNIICSLYITIGSRWSVIAAKLPGRTDNDVKNYWNTKLKKKFLAGQISSSSVVPSPPSQHHLPTSTQSVKLENHGFSNSHPNQLNSSATVALPVPMDTDFRHNSNSQRLVSVDPTHSQFAIMSLPSPANAASSAASSSYHQEVISPSVLQSSLTFENSYSFWSGNGGGINGTDHQDADGFYMDFGFNPSSYDFLYDLGFQYQEKSSTSTSTEAVVASNSANTSSTLLYANLLAANSTTTTTTSTDTKPQQGMYQSVRN